MLRPRFATPFRAVSVSLSPAIVALILALGFVVTEHGMAQARINGQVRLPAGETKSPDVVRVSLLTVDGGYVRAKTLSAESSFIFDRVPNGQYWITVESPGFEPGRRWVDINAPWSKFEIMVIVELGPREEAGDKPESQPEHGNETVSVSSLKVPPKAWKEYQSAVQDEERKQHEKAVEHLKKALAAYPEFAQAYTLLGAVLSTSGQLQPAADALSNAVSLSPQDPKLRRNLAQLLLSLSRFEEAVDELNQAATIDPENSKTWRLLGEAFLGLRDCETALDYFEAAVKLNPDDRSFLGFGQCYLQNGRTGEALAEFQQFVSQNPADPRTSAVRELIEQLQQEGAAAP